MLPNSFYEESVNLTPNPSKDMKNKEGKGGKEFL
jgi:hypothetical protein